MNFVEKPKSDAWASAGFFVFEREVLDYLDGDECILESEPLERLAAEGQLVAYNHDGFFYAMDTYREFQILNDLWKSGQAPWKEVGLRLRPEELRDNKSYNWYRSTTTEAFPPKHFSRADSGTRIGQGFRCVGHVQSLVDSGLWISGSPPGRFAAQFEKAVCAMVRGAEATLVNSGSSAESAGGHRAHV